MLISDSVNLEYHVNEDLILARALDILKNRISKSVDVFNSPSLVKNYLIMQAANFDDKQVEKFGCIYLDGGNKFIADKIHSIGTLNQCAVYVKEIARAAIKHNACSVILFHNHPSGELTPSRADIGLTSKIRDALLLIDVNVTDHFITNATGQALSMAEMGLL